MCIRDRHSGNRYRTGDQECQRSDIRDRDHDLELRAAPVSYTHLHNRHDDQPAERQSETERDRTAAVAQVSGRSVFLFGLQKEKRH